MENDTKNKKDEVLFVKVSSDEKTEVNEIVAQQGGEMTVSRFVREAVREKIASIKQQETETAGVAA